MGNPSFYFALLILFISVQCSVSVEYLPEDRKIEVIEVTQFRYIFGIKFDPELELSECKVTSNTGISHRFRIEPRSSINKDVRWEDTRANFVSDRGYEGLCQIIVSNVENHGLTQWNLEAQSNYGIVANTSFTVHYLNNVPIHADSIHVIESASFSNYLMFPNNTAIDACRVRLETGSVVDLDLHTPRINTVNEKISNKITSLGQGLCGFRYKNAAQELNYMDWTLIATDREGIGYGGAFTTSIEYKIDPYFNRTSVSLGQEYDLKCYPRGFFCHIFNPAGELVESKNCTHKIVPVKIKDIGLWKCRVLSWQTMETIEGTTELVAVSKAPIGWTNETQYYVQVGCQTSNFASICRMTPPNGKMFRVDAGYATDRHFSFGTDLEKGICSIMISKPLQNSEKGLWKCELAGYYTQGALITVGGTTPPYPRNLQVTATLNKPLTINCEVPYFTDYCRIMSPKGPGHTYPPDDENELSLGRCSHRIESAQLDDMGAWTCMIGRETGLTDEKIVVTVTFGELLQHSPNVTAPLGGDAELLCKTKEVPLGYCRFTSPRGESYNIRDTDTGSSLRISYFGKGFSYGECGIKISSLTRNDMGHWRCDVLPLPGKRVEIGYIQLVIP